MNRKYDADTEGFRFSSGGTSKRIKSSLAQASKIAEMSTYGSFKHGAVIKKGGSVVSVGVNSWRNHPTVVTDPMREAAVHAEIAALKSARGSDLKGATIYIARVLNNGDQAMSRPCANCINALREAGIRKIFYTIDGEMDL